MLYRTHLVIGLFVSLFFLSHVTHKLSFIPLVLLATILPDIDSAFSALGKTNVGKFLRLFTKHRGLLHSFTFVVLITGVFVLYLPIVALPFFLGYSLHLLLDSVSVEGIRPFWPLKLESKGKLSVGKAVEEAIFMCFVIIDLIFLASFFL